MDILLSIISGLAVIVIPVVVLHLLIGVSMAGIVMQGRNKAYGIKTYEYYLLFFEQQYISDRWRNPRSSELAEIKKQLKAIRSLDVPESEAEQLKLESELKQLQLEPILHEEQLQLIADTAKFQLHKSDIEAWRQIRDDTTRRVAEEHRYFSAQLRTIHQPDN